MDATYDGDLVRAGPQAREQFYDARGYGRPDDGALALAPVEAAHLLYRGDLDRVIDQRSADAAPLDFRSFLASSAVSETAFFVYADLRDRGFYLSAVRDDPAVDFRVYPRGDGPWDDAVAYRVRAIGERATVAAETLRALAADDGVLAVVDEESELTYFDLSVPDPTGSTNRAVEPARGDLLGDRVLVWNPPDGLYERAFYGQRLDDATVQLSLVEAASLARRDRLTLDRISAPVDATSDATGDARGGTADETPAETTDARTAETDDAAAIVARGRAVEGERFDRRLRVYDALRAAGVVPKTGYKFGADFRTYAAVDHVDDLGHSELLVRVLPADHAVSPRDLALDVRLAGGVRKRMVFALTGANGGIDWLAAGRLTP